MRILGGVVALILLAAPQGADAAGTVPLDSFGDSGRVTAALGGHPQGEESNATVVQPDGRVVVAGTAQGDLAIARYALDGSLDPEFGGGQGFTISDLDRLVGVHSVTLDPEGRIVVAGSLGEAYELQDVFVARYLADGTLDPSFGGTGVVVHDLGAAETCGDVVVRPTGEVLCGVWALPAAAADFVLIQWTADGQLDPAFGSGGIVRTSWSSNSRDELSGIALGPSGSVIAVGRTEGSPYEDIGVARYLPDGGLDPDFGEGGLVRASFGESDFAVDAVVRPDGRVVLLGGTSPTIDHFMFVGLTEDGELDPTFGDGGQAIVAAGDDDQPSSIALQPDGRIVAAGSSRVPERRAEFGLVRVLPDGAADPTFGGDGSVMTSVYGSPSVDEEAHGLALDPAGRLVLVGYAARGHFATLRFLPDGSLDPTFDEDGKAFATMRPYYSVGAGGVLEQADGGVVVAGTYALRYERSGARVPFVARYLPDGSLDPAFGGGDGVAVFEPGSSSGVAALKTAPDGDLMVAGGVALSGGGTGYYVTKLDPDGDLDAAFGVGGTRVVDLGPDVVARGLAVAGDGSAVVAGWTEPNASQHGMALLRLLADGTEDPGFGTGGVVITSFSHDSTEGAEDVAFLSDGSIIAVGASDRFDDYELADFALAKFHGDGAVDQSFGTGGLVRTNLQKDEFSESMDTAEAITVDAVDRITLAGSSYWNQYPGTHRFALARYTSGGTLMSQFGGDGIVVTNIAGGGHYEDIETDGAGVIAAGQLVRYGGTEEFVLARYTGTGALDTGFASGGMVTADFFGDDDRGTALSVSPNGTATVAGSSADGAGSSLLGLARFTIGYDAPPPADPPGSGDPSPPSADPPGTGASGGDPLAGGDGSKHGKRCKPKRRTKGGRCVKRVKKRKPSK